MLSIFIDISLFIIHLSIYLSIYYLLSIYLSIIHYPSIYLSIYYPLSIIHLSIHYPLSIIHLSIYYLLFIIHLFIHYPLSTYLSIIHLSIHYPVSIYLSIIRPIHYPSILSIIHLSIHYPSYSIIIHLYYPLSIYLSIIHYSSIYPLSVLFIIHLYYLLSIYLSIIKARRLRLSRSSAVINCGDVAVVVSLSGGDSCDSLAVTAALSDTADTSWDLSAVLFSKAVIWGWDLTAKTLLADFCRTVFFATIGDCCFSAYVSCCLLSLDWSGEDSVYLSWSADGDVYLGFSDLSGN